MARAVGTAPSAPTAGEMIARARFLAPALAQRAEACERGRTVPEETIADFLDLGLNRAMQPARYGGYEMGWDVLCETALELGRGCAAQGWVLAVYGDHTQWLGMFPREAQDDVWGADARSLIATAYAPMGRASPKPGGYALSGRWSFASGIDHASWLLAGAMLPDEANAGRPRHVIFLVPKSDAIIIDDWHVAGLAGTGSKSFLLDEAFVPAHRMIEERDFADGTAPGSRENSAPVYRFPRRSTAGLASVLVGAALGMVDEFCELCRDKARRGRRAASEPIAALRVAEAAAELDCARWLLVGSARETMAILARGETSSAERRILNRRNQAEAALLTCSAVDRIFASAGGGAIYLSSRLQRIFRDVHAGAAHFSLSFDFAAMPYGYLRLGQDPDSNQY